jgi:tetratricopeptide (TPR) repeat protein
MLTLKTVGEKRPSKIFLSKRWKILAGILVVLILAFAFYYGFGRYLTSKINNSYEFGQCVEVVRLVELTRKIYPSIILPFSSQLSAHHRECQMYLSATKAQEQQDWSNAYTAYKDYLLHYPNGVLVAVAKENEAKMLLSWSETQYETKQYQEAVDHLVTFLEEYRTTPLVSNAEVLLPKCYLEWGRELQDEQNYAVALEKYVLTIEADTKLGDTIGPSGQARVEIPRLYLQWADFLSSRNEFDDALEKYKLAIETDANSVVSSSVPSQAQAKIPHLYLQWADFLASQGKFDDAMIQYETYVSMASPNDRASAQDAMVNGQLLWAEALRNDNDFWCALDKISLAETNAFSEESKKKVEQAQMDTYVAFSISSENQAQQLMDEVVKNLMEKKQTPELPIFAIDKEHMRIYVLGEGKNVSGIKNKISNDILAQTPGEMYYIAHVSEDATVTGSCGGSYLEIQPTVRVVSYTYLLYTPQWMVNLIDVNTGASVEKRGIFGTSPHCTEKSRSDLFGSPPQVEDLEAWLRTFVK